LIRGAGLLLNRKALPLLLFPATALHPFPKSDFLPVFKSTTCLLYIPWKRFLLIKLAHCLSFEIYFFEKSYCPPVRIITATALTMESPLITGDEKILAVHTLPFFLAD
jgi:hypothetical protein